MQRVKSLQQQLDESEKQLIELHKISSKEDEELKRQVVALQKELDYNRQNMSNAASSISITKQEAAQLVIPLEEEKKCIFNYFIALTQQVNMLKIQLRQAQDRANEIEENVKTQMTSQLNDKQKELETLKQVY